MTLKNSKRLYLHYIEQSKSGKTDFARKIAKSNADNILKVRPQVKQTNKKSN